LKQRHYHNKSWIDSKNKTAIKNVKQCAKKNPINKQGAFGNLQEFRSALDAHRQPKEEFLCSKDPPPAITAGAQSTNQDISALGNIIVLHHDVGTHTQQWFGQQLVGDYCNVP
jgi:hypothetical protein